MGAFDPAAISARLSRGQRHALAGLDEEFCALGCSEPWVMRLCKGGKRRPALAIEGPRDERGYRTFALNDAGRAVKAALGLG